jgi:hypothetical protein
VEEAVASMVRTSEADQQDRRSAVETYAPVSNGYVENRKFFLKAHPIEEECGIRTLSSDVGFTLGTTKTDRFLITPQEAWVR